MMPSEQFGSVPRVGIEIEVAHWGSSDVKERSLVCQNLVDAGFMPDSPTPFQAGYHQYNCRCKDCTRWEAEDVDPYPVQFTLEYDASLPEYGGEFITSPFPVLPDYMRSFYDGWKMVTARAVRDLKVKNRDGDDYASPSVHVHSSCMNPEHYDGGVALAFFSAFAPEIFGFATCTGLDRGLKFRHTDFDEKNGAYVRGYAHHRFVNIKPLQVRGLADARNAGPHVELRVWEADYANDRYIRGAVNITAALTQLAANAAIANKMTAYTIMADRGRLVCDDKHKDCNPLLGEVRSDMLDVLASGMGQATFMRYDDEAHADMMWMIEETRRYLNVG